jgi:hypothetical protein
MSTPPPTDGESKGTDTTVAEAAPTGKMNSTGVLDKFELIDREIHIRKIPKTNFIVSARRTSHFKGGRGSWAAVEEGTGVARPSLWRCGACDCDQRLCV